MLNTPKRPGEINPYEQYPDVYEQPPTGAQATLRHLGPGMILVGAIVGSGELIMTTKLGAVVGFSVLWFVILSCVLKAVVQAELARYTISSGETFLETVNNLPGPSGRHPTWLTPGFVGIVSVSFLCGFLAQGLGAERFGGRYAFIENVSIGIVTIFTVITVVCTLLLQLTDHAISFDDLRRSMAFDFPVLETVGVFLLLGMYANTAVTGPEMISYTYWCHERGYARNTGANVPGPA